MGLTLQVWLSILFILLYASVLGLFFHNIQFFLILIIFGTACYLFGWFDHKEWSGGSFE